MDRWPGARRVVPAPLRRRR